MKKILIGLMVAMVATCGFADLIATWDFTGFAGNEASAAGSMLANMEASTLTRGGGLGATGNGDRFCANGFADTLANALTGADYFTFTLEASSTYAFSLSSMVFNFQASGTGPQSWALFSSVTGWNEVDVLENWAGVGNGVTETADLSGVTALQSASSAIEFRVYGYGASGTGGTGGFEGTGDDIVVNGTVAPSAIPEPATMSLLGLGALAMVLRRKIRK